ncbi:MAG: sensor histidine kinase [Parasphingorhabdus sp.]|uniref:sensor histidine kinase n=1 Tax=Parasphingorhabdus sp. TaxID=2709688 RepID=UPI0032983C55
MNRATDIINQLVQSIEHKLRDRLTSVLLILFSFAALVIVSDAAKANLQVIDLADISTIDDIQTISKPVFRQQTGQLEFVRYNLQIENSDEQPLLFRVVTEEAARAEVLISLVSQGQKEILLKSRPRFKDAETLSSQNLQLESRPIVITDSEPVRLEIDINFARNDRAFPISLISEDQFIAKRQFVTAVHGLYFGSTLFAVVLAAGFAILMRSHVIALFSFYTFTLIMLNVHTYGYATPYLPEFFSAHHDGIKRILRLSWCVFYFFFATSFTKASRNAPRMFRIALFVAGVTVINSLVGAMFHLPITTLIMVATGTGFLAFVGYFVWTAVRQKVKGAGLFALGFSILLAYVLLTIRAGFPDVAEYNDWFDTAALFLLVLDCLVFSAAIITQVRGIIMERDKSKEQQLAAAVQSSEIANRLAQAHVDRNAALVEISRARRNLSETRHDLRQPLVSLQSALSGVDPKNRELHRALEWSIDYIDQLLSATILDEAGAVTSTKRKTEDIHSRQETALGEHLLTLEQMFGDEALNKGCALEVGKSDLVLAVPSVAIHRILSNLIDNAIKHSGATRIGVETGQHEEKAWIEVTDDGVGVPPDVLEKIAHTDSEPKPDQKWGPHGMGLGIARSISTGEGLLLEHCPEENGTRWRLSGIPLAKPR